MYYLKHIKNILKTSSKIFICCVLNAFSTALLSVIVKDRQSSFCRSSPRLFPYVIDGVIDGVIASDADLFAQGSRLQIVKWAMHNVWCDGKHLQEPWESAGMVRTVEEAMHPREFCDRVARLL